jgi:molecular chaperone GrpE
MKKDHSDHKKQTADQSQPEEHDLQENTAESDNENERLETLEADFAKLKEDYLRVLAESENIKKRCAAEIEKNNKYAVSSFAKDLLGVADNLSRAIESSKNSDHTDCTSLMEGVVLTQTELTHVFAKFGIEAVDSLGKAFDPNYHRAVQEISDPTQPKGTVVAELQKGYLINGRILREAMVVVNKA